MIPDNEIMKANYTVKELSSSSGVSVRTLHHYDEIGLLSPMQRSGAGYRIYGQKELLRLQQILFYKELEVPLKEIGRILDDPDFDESIALIGHKQALLKRRVQLDNLLKTIDRTLLKLEEDKMITDKELYQGFTEEQIKRYEKEIEDNFDPKLVAESKRRIKKMSKNEWANVKAEMEEINKELAQALNSGFSFDSKEVQNLVSRHYKWVNNFYTPTKEVYRGLGDLYVTNPEFKESYEKYGMGLAAFLSSAIKKYSESL